MAEKENQHFVPQYYFRNFSADGRSICLLVRSSGKFVSKAPIKSQSSKSYFYGDAGVENQITEIESSFIPAQRRLVEGERFSCLSHDDQMSILQSLMLQKSRTMTARVDREESMHRFTQLYLEAAINDDKELTEDQKIELREMLPNVEACPEPHQSMWIGIAISHAQELSDLKRVLLINKTSRPFIFGDAPVIFTNPMQRLVVDRGVLGARTPGLIVYFPLTPKYAVLLVDNCYKVKGLKGDVLDLRDLSDLRQLNKLQLHNAFSAVYFGDEAHAEYVRGMWEEERRKLVNSRGVFKEEKIQVDGQLGEIFATFDRQLPLVPRLSFLHHFVVPKDSKLIDRKDLFMGFSELV